MHAVGIRIFNPFAFTAFKGFWDVVEAPEPRDPEAARKAFDKLIYDREGCRRDVDAQMLMAMYPDQF
ncbi:MAG: hypothetical protein AAFN59_00420 [Pseudomonadota bacterium]